MLGGIRRYWGGGGHKNPLGWLGWAPVDTGSYWLMLVSHRLCFTPTSSAPWSWPPHPEGGPVHPLPSAWMPHCCPRCPLPAPWPHMPPLHCEPPHLVWHFPSPPPKKKVEKRGKNGQFWGLKTFRFCGAESDSFWEQNDSFMTENTKFEAENGNF